MSGGSRRKSRLAASGKIRKLVWPVVALLVTLAWAGIARAGGLPPSGASGGWAWVPQGNPPPTQWQPASPEGRFVEDELLVRFKSGVEGSRRAAVRRDHGARIKRGLPVAGLQLVGLARGSSVRAAAASFEREPEVLYAEPNFRYRYAATTPNDSRFGELWGLHNTGQVVDGVTGTADADIDAPEAWDTTRGGAVTVAIVDSGVAYDNPELAGNIWSNPGETGGGRESNNVDDDGNGLVDDSRGWDFAAGDNDPRDPLGHGSHVAGTVGAEGNNGQGTSGVNWQVDLMPLGAGALAPVTTAVVSAFGYAAAKGAKVVNASLSGPFSQAVRDAIDAAPNTLFVVAAGNGGGDGIGDNNDLLPVYPCNYPAANLICVAATNQNDVLAGFSNYGASSVDLAAPGVNVLSTQPAFGPVFSDGFETDIVGRWTTGGANNSWARTDALARTGSFSLTDSPGTSYLSNTNSFAQTSFSLSGRSGCWLDHALRFDLESGFDFLYAEGSTNAATWSLIGRGTGTTGTFIEPSDPLFGFDGGPSIYLRYRLQSDGSLNRDGAYADDVTVRCLTASYAGNEYAIFDGTSMAAPHVTGVAALVWAQNPTASVADVRQRILGGVDPKPSLAGRVATGGRLNANNALAPSSAEPNTTITSGPSGPTNDPTPTFTFTSDQTGSTFECRVDTGTFAACTSPHTTAALSDGARTFEVRARNTAGTFDPSPASRAFTVDTVAPETTITSGPSGDTNDSTPTFEFTSDQTGSTFQCRVDGGGLSSCTSPHTTPLLANGPHTFEVQARDPAGNLDSTPASRGFTITVTVQAPNTTITSGPTGTTNDSTPTFTFISDQAGSTFECRVDTAAFAGCSSPHTTTTLPDGGHTFEVRARNTAGTLDPSPASRSFTVSTRPPDPEPQIPPCPPIEAPPGTPTYTGSHFSGGGSVCLTVSPDWSAITSFLAVDVPGDRCRFFWFRIPFGERIPVNLGSRSFGGSASGTDLSGSFPSNQDAAGTVRTRTPGVFSSCDTGPVTWRASTTATPPWARPIAAPPQPAQPVRRRSACAGLRGTRLRRCRALQRCNRLRGKRKRRCQALARCTTLKGKKKKRCIRKARRIGSKKRRARRAQRALVAGQSGTPLAITMPGDPRSTYVVRLDSGR